MKQPFCSYMKKGLLIAAVSTGLALSMILSAAATSGIGSVVPIAETDAIKTEDETRPGNSTSVGGAATSEKKAVPAVSYGLRVLAAQDEMVFSAMCGNEIGFTAEDIRRAMNLSSLGYITICELPEPGEGTLFVGSMGAAEGQVISAGSMGLLSFAAANDQKPGEATMKISVNGSDYAITCRLCLVDRLNFTPTVSLAPAVSLQIETYRDIPTHGTVSGYDPEGDEITYEIVRYATHGRVTLTNKHTGAYIYTPDAGYVGKDSFDYVVRDRYGNYSTSATVSVRVAARPSAATFSDIDGVSDAAAIIKVASLGLMNGTQVGAQCYFKPEEAISRVEFLVTALQAAGIAEKDVAALADPSVADVEDIPVAMRPYVSYALQKNYVAGKVNAGRTFFKPNDRITRAEAAVILSNIIGYAIEDTVTAFADADAMPTWSRPALVSLRALGIVIAPAGKADAGETMTRANTAAWLARTLSLIGRG